VDVRAAQHQNHMRILELLVPGVLERGEHGRVRFDGIGELVEDEDVGRSARKAAMACQQSAHESKVAARAGSTPRRRAKSLRRCRAAGSFSAAQ